MHRVLTSFDRMEASFSLPAHPHLHSPSPSHFTSHPTAPALILRGQAAPVLCHLHSQPDPPQGGSVQVPGLPQGQRQGG